MCSIRKVITALLGCISKFDPAQRKTRDFTPATAPANHSKANTNRKSPIGNRKSSRFKRS